MKSTDLYRLATSLALLIILLVMFFTNLTALQDGILANLLIALVGTNFMVARYARRKSDNQPVNFLSLLKDGYFIASYLLFWLGIAFIIITIIEHT